MNTIPFEQFEKLRIGSGLTADAERVEGADKLLKLQVDFGNEKWKFIDPLSKNRTPTRFYKAGSWGPKEAFDLIEKDGRKWLEPYVAFCQI